MASACCTSSQARRADGVSGVAASGWFGGQDVAHVGVLVGWLAFAGGHGHDGDLDDYWPCRLGPVCEIVEARFFTRFAQGDCERIGFARVGVAADLQPALHALVPAQQDSAGWRDGR